MSDASKDVYQVIKDLVDPVTPEVAIGTVLALVLLTMFLYILSRVQSGGTSSGLVTSAKSSSKRGNGSVLICGPSNSGKTCLFYKLLSCNDITQLSQVKKLKLPKTQASLMPNIDTAECSLQDNGAFSFNCRLVDYSGLLPFDQEIVCQKNGGIDISRDIRGVIVMIDGNDSKSIQQACEHHLFTLLESSVIIEKKVAVLVVLNKNSEMMSESSQSDDNTSNQDLASELLMIESVKSSMIRQLNDLRNSRSTLASVNSDDTVNRNQVALADSTQSSIGRRMNWSDLPTSVEFISISVLNNHLEPVFEFLNQVSV